MVCACACNFTSNIDVHIDLVTLIGAGTGILWCPGSTLFIVHSVISLNLVDITNLSKSHADTFPMHPLYRSLYEQVVTLDNVIEDHFFYIIFSAMYLARVTCLHVWLVCS